MRPIRVLVVDDAVVVRRLFTAALAEDPTIEVVGTAANGKIALAKIPQLSPDVITLDVEMPEMDGLETLAAIRKSYPRLPVIMVSSLTVRGAAVTIDALSLGASDYVTKPSRTGGPDETLRCLREVLIPRIQALGGRAVAGVQRAAPAAAPAGARTERAGGRVDVVAIGVSTGGPNALGMLLPMLPATFPVPVLIVQHMPKLFTQLLAERLAARGPLPVAEAVDGEVLQPGRVWIAPGDFHLTVARDGAAIRLHTHQEAPENFCRPAVDVLFRSVAEAYGRQSLAVVLTGMGQDGVRGCRRIREAGGQIVVQDEATSVAWGMPGGVAGEGLADAVLPLDQIGGEVLRRVQSGQGAVPRPGAAAVAGGR
jgi:two-component system chemotaxis response regulator CheB